MRAHESTHTHTTITDSHSWIKISSVTAVSLLLCILTTVSKNGHVHQGVRGQPETHKAWSVCVCVSWAREEVSKRPHLVTLMDKHTFILCTHPSVHAGIVIMCGSRWSTGQTQLYTHTHARARTRHPSQIITNPGVNMAFTCEQREGLRGGKLHPRYRGRYWVCPRVAMYICNDKGLRQRGDSLSSRMGGIIIGKTHACNTGGEIHSLVI